MARRLSSVELDFAESAKVRLVFTARLSARPDAVFRALADEVAATPVWFSPVVAARHLDGGAGREVRLRGGVFFRETIMAREAGARYAYRIDETNVPGVTAMLEDWRLVASGSGTAVRWTMASEGPALFRLAMRGAGPGVGRSFKNAMRNLNRVLAPTPAP
ncbi:SRPBCC family protein [Streptomyces sp. NBC_00083]|uniref:SRPBCC family protein n=1 Tax=Streptomyces sp. NBC_00083 TaxID=2975647 RepID=UPI0022578356|nr:SRPBCC family protein [Streptomyces sp. NBC_00083]MCX5383907.1 SRPBCC family protein [Streptomyces sp. NBC_00083]